LKPGVMPQDGWTGKPIDDIERAQGIAESEYQIPRLIDSIDIHECPDELSMMTYVSYFRDWWLDQEKRMAAEREAERLRKMRTADPTQCYAEGPGLTHGTTNNPAPFTIHSVNYFGDPLPTGGDHYEIELTGGHENPHVDNRDNNNGTYSCQYVATKVGDLNLKISLRGTPIKGSPYRPSISGPSAKNSFAHGPGVEGARINKPANFTVESRDQNGKQVPTGNDPFSVKVQDPQGKPVMVQFHDGKNGTYEGSYTPTSPGRYTVEITLGNEPIKGSPYHPLMEQANAGRSYAEGPGLHAGQTKKPCNFTIHALDGDGNHVGKGGDPYKVDISGPESPQLHFHDNNDGTYSVEYSVLTPGDYTIDVTLHGDRIKDSPFHPHIKWSCDPAQCWAEGEGLHEVFDNKPTQFTIHAVDYDGNPRHDGGDPFVVKIHSPNETITPRVVDNNDGTYTVSYAADKPGPIDIHVTLEGDQIKDAPFHVVVKSGTDASHTGFKSFTFTIQTRDKHGRDKNFGGDEFEVKPTGAHIDVHTHDNNDGSYTAEFALSQKGSFSFRVFFNQHELACSPLTVHL